ncbi:MAG: PAS domain-containing sensor histidine kinase [Phycisphaerales bacterium]|nr:PAS domain-containing sensor histidine kinase [Phycisphaerales bacterium]
MSVRDPRIRSSALQIVAPYLALGVVWILVSDKLAAAWGGAQSAEQWIQTVKGLGFVGATGGLLYALCIRRFGALVVAERELRESERRFSSIMSNLCGMAYQCLADHRGTMLFVSRGAEALTGYSVGELLHNRSVVYEELIHAEDRERVRAAVDAAVSRRSGFGIEYRIVACDGTVRWVWEQGLVVPGPGGDAVLMEGFVSDITDRKALESLEEERRVLRDSRRAVDEALGAIGHELRTPLASQRLMAEALLEPDLDAGSRAEFARGILEQTDRLTEMATNMLEGARLGEGHAVWRWGPLNLCQVVGSAVAVMSPLASRWGVAVEVACGESGCGCLEMRGDADALRRVVINLLSNACRHAPSGRVVVSAERGGDGLVIRVRDDGRGMSPDVLAKLGQAFALNTGTVSDEASAGVGLGLAICRQIVAAHGGRMEVSSREGEGTTMTVTLPTDREGPRESFEPEPIRLAA